jgi:hypothetical protein
MLKLLLRNDQSTGLRCVLVVGGLAVMVILNIGRVVGDDNSWESARGTEMKADFIDTCHRGSASAVVDCECVFQRITAGPPYDTPDGFATLMESADPPAAFVAAYNSCPLPGSQPL